MSAGVAMRECRQCGHVIFPPRQLCPNCGAWDWKRTLALTGVVERVTWRRPRQLRRQTPLGHWIDRANIQLAWVRSDRGPHLTVLAPDGNLERGMTVELESHASVSVAREAVELRAKAAPPA
jgi:uncharacterized OB-fold protein